MGLFTTRMAVCDKCHKTTVFDGPYSDCGCYSPDTPTVFEPELTEEEIKEIEKIVDNIKFELIKYRYTKY